MIAHQQTSRTGPDVQSASPRRSHAERSRGDLLDRLDFYPLDGAFVELVPPAPSVRSGLPDPSENAIFVFTKNQPERLARTLPLLAAQPYPVVLLDDSTSDITRRWLAGSGLAGRVHYHGRVEQAPLLRRFDLHEVNPFVTPLGDPTWHLPACRNYALLLARALGLKGAMLLDDDIALRSSLQLAESLAWLRQYSIVGAATNGMPDDSATGHLIRLLDGPPPEFISGQYVALRVEDVAFHFPSVYNEDWLFFLFHSTCCSLARCGAVEQLEYTPLLDFSDRSAFQEFGEVAVDGAIDAIVRDGQVGHLLQARHWEPVLARRQRQHRTLRDEVRAEDPSLREALGELERFTARLAPADLTAFFRSYLAEVDAWRTALHHAAVDRISLGDITSERFADEAAK